MKVDKSEIISIKTEIETCKSMEDIREMQHSLNDMYITFPEYFSYRLKKLIYYFIKFKIYIISGQKVNNNDIIVDKK